MLLLAPPCLSYSALHLEEAVSSGPNQLCQHRWQHLLSKAPPLLSDLWPQQAARHAEAVLCPLAVSHEVLKGVWGDGAKGLGSKSRPQGGRMQGGSGGGGIS